MDQGKGNETDNLEKMREKLFENRSGVFRT